MEKIEVGDWVVNSEGEVFKIESFFDYAWCIEGKEHLFRKATEEEIHQEIRRRMFATVERNLNEWKPNDVVLRGDDVPKKIAEVKEDNVRLQSSNDEAEEWHHKKEITPLYFVENMVVADSI